MTAAQRQTVSDLWVRTTQAATFLGNLILIAGSITAIVLWVTGGLKPQSQVQSDELAKDVKAIQGDVADMKSDMKKHFEGLPAPWEVQAQRDHFNGLDNRMAAAESDIHSLQTSVKDLYDRVPHVSYRGTEH
jgi:uncharacterized protein YukE